MGTFAIEKGHQARWLNGSLQRLSEMSASGLVSDRQRRVMRKFAVRVAPDRQSVLFKTSDVWLEARAPDFIRALGWTSEKPALPEDEEGEVVAWVRDDGWLDQLLGLELSDDEQPLQWEI